MGQCSSQPKARDQEARTASPEEIEMALRKAGEGVEDEAKKEEHKEAIRPAEPQFFESNWILSRQAPLDPNQPIHSTTILARLFSQLRFDDPYRPLLHDLALRVLEAFSRRIVKTPTLVEEVTVLARMSDGRILTKVLQAFLNTIHQSAALDVDMIDGLSEVLKYIDPRAWSKPHAEKKEPKDSKKGKESGVSMDIAGFSAVDTLVKLLVTLMGKLDELHQQKENRTRVIQLLRALNRILAAMFDAGIEGISKDELRKPLYQTLKEFAKDGEQDGEQAYWATHAIQSLLRLPTDETWAGGLWKSLKRFAIALQKLKDAVVDMSFESLEEAYGDLKETFSFETHGKSGWYYGLKMCQLMMELGRFKDLERALLLKEVSEEMPESLRQICNNRRLSAFQLGLMSQIDDVMRSPRWPESIKRGCFQLLKHMYMNEEHWQDRAGKLHRRFKAFFHGKAHDERLASTQLLKQLVGYVKEKPLRLLAQTTLLEMRAELDTLSDTHQKLFNKTVPLILEAVPLSPPKALSSGKELLEEARKQAERRSLLWKIYSMRTKVLNDPDHERELEAYVHPDGYEKDKDPSKERFDLLQEALYFAGLRAGVACRKGDEGKDEAAVLKEDSKGLGDVKAADKPSGANPYKVLLLLGKAGSGKSTFGHYLQKHLWEGYRKGGYIPLFISLINVKRLDRFLIETHLQQQGFTVEQIQTIKRSSAYPLLLILDGYDELNTQMNIYQQNSLHQWPGLKVIVSCRPTQLRGDDRKAFVPTDASGAEIKAGLFERYMAPFTDSQITTYLKRYVTVSQKRAGSDWQGWKSWQEYEHRMNSMEGLTELIRNPFILKIVIDVLPDMFRKREEAKAFGATTATDTAMRISRFDLYQSFTEQWFSQAKAKLTKSEVDAAKAHLPVHFRFQLGDHIEADYTDFSLGLAAYLFTQRKITATYRPQWTRERMGGGKQVPQLLDKFFDPGDPVLTLVRRGCPLQRQGMRYGFLHKSLWEYFTAVSIYQEIKAAPIPWEEKTLPAGAPDSKITLPLAVCINVRVYLRAIRQRLAKRAEQRSHQPIALSWQDTKPTSLLINQRLLNGEPSIIQFLADIVRADTHFRDKLWYWLLCSKHNKSIGMASANALTVLNAAGHPFSATDLRGIYAPGANLSYGIFDHTDFSGAKISKTNFHNAFLNQTNFSGTDLRHAFFASTGGEEIDQKQVNKMLPKTADEKEERVAEIFKFKITKDKILVTDTRTDEELTPFDNPGAGQMMSDTRQTHTPDAMTYFFYSITYNLSTMEQESPKTMTCYSVEQKACLAPIVLESTAGANSIVHSPDSAFTFFYNSGRSGSTIIEIFDNVKQEKLESLHHDKALIRNVVFSPNHSFVFFYTSSEKCDEHSLKPNPAIFAYDLKSRERLPDIPCKDAPSSEITFLKDETIAVFHIKVVKKSEKTRYRKREDLDKTAELLVYDLPNRKQLASVELKYERSTAVTSPDEKLIFMYNHGGDDGPSTIHVFDVEKKELLPSISTAGLINNFRCMESEHLMIFYNWSTPAPRFPVFDYVNKKELSPVESKEPMNKLFIEKSSQLAFAYFGSYGAVPSRLTTDVIVYDLQQKKVDGTFQCEKALYNAVVLSDGHPRVVFFQARHGKQFKVYDCVSRSAGLPVKLEEPIFSIIGIENNEVLVIRASHTCYIYELATQKLSVLKKMNNNIESIDRIPGANKFIIQTSKEKYYCSNWKRVLGQTKTSGVSRLSSHLDPIKRFVLSGDSLASIDYKKDDGDRNMSLWAVTPYALTPLQQFNHVAPKPFFFPNEQVLVFSYTDVKDKKDHFCVYDMCKKMLTTCMESPGRLKLFSGPRERSKEGYPDSINPDSKVIFAAHHECDEKKAKSLLTAYDLVTRKVLETYPLHNVKIFPSTGKAIFGMRFSPKAGFAFAALADSVMVYDMHAKKRLPDICHDTPKPIDYFDFSPDETMVFLSSNPPFSKKAGAPEIDSVYVYDLQNRKELSPIRLLEKNEDTSVAFTSDSSTAFIKTKTVVFVYDVTRRTLLPNYISPKGGFVFNHTVISHDEKVALFSQRKSRSMIGAKKPVYPALLTLYGIAEKKVLNTIPTRTSELRGVSVMQNYGLLFLCGSSSYLNSVYDLVTGKEIEVLHKKFHKSWVDVLPEQGVALMRQPQPRAHSFAQRALAEAVCVYDLRSRTMLQEVKPALEYITASRFTHDRSLAFFYNHNYKKSNAMVVYDTDAKQVLGTLEADSKEASLSILSYRDAFLLFLKDRKTAESGLFAHHKKDMALLFSVPFSAGKIFGQFVGFHEEKGEMFMRYSSRPYEECASTFQHIDGTLSSLVAMIFYSSTGCYFWNRSDDSLHVLLHGMPIETTPCISNNGKRMIIAGADCIARVWDISDRSRPVLQYASAPLSFHASDILLDEKTTISLSNQRLLKKHRFLESQSSALASKKAPPASLFSPTKKAPEVPQADESTTDEVIASVAP